MLTGRFLLLCLHKRGWSERPELLTAAQCARCVETLPANWCASVGVSAEGLGGMELRKSQFPRCDILQSCKDTAIIYFVFCKTVMGTTW